MSGCERVRNVRIHVDHPTASLVSAFVTRLGWSIGRPRGQVVIAKSGVPQARLVPLAQPVTPRRPGGWEGHGDPFDRMLVAQARLEGLTLVTHDRQLAPYDAPFLWT